MATPWTSTVEQLRGPAAPPPPQPTEWTAQRLRTLSPDRPPGGFARGGPYVPPDGVKPFGAGTPAAPAAAPPVPPAAAAEAKSVGLGRRVADALRNPGKTLTAAVPTAHGAGKAAGVATRVLGPVAAGADVVAHLNDYKINDPTNDSSASGTFNALRNMGVGDAARLLNPAAALGAVAGGGLGDLGRSISKGALEAGMDLGSTVANTADFFVPGAPVSTAYNGMLREKFGDQLVDRTGTAPAAPATPAAPVAPTANPNYGNEHLRGPVASQPPTNVVTRTGNSFSGMDVKQGFTYANGSQGKGTVTSLDTSEGHRQNLLELQRNAAERANAPAPAGAAGIGGAGSTTMSQDLRAKTDAGQTPRGLSPYDTAQLQQQQAQTQQQGELGRAQIAATQTGNNNALRVAEMNNATQRENNAATTRTALRGHELDYERGMAPLRFQQQQREQIAGLLRASGGDPAAAARTALEAGRVDLAETLSKPVATMQEQAGKADALTETKRKEIATGVKGAFNHMDKDGQPKMSEALEAKAVARIMRTNPDFHKEGDPAKRQKMLDDALGDEELMARFEKPTSGGYGSITPNFLTGNKPMLRQDNIPNAELLARGQIGEPIGGLRNLLSPNTSKGDRFFDPGDGYEAVNMGDLSARALARLDQHRKEAAERLRK